MDIWLIIAVLSPLTLLLLLLPKIEYEVNILRKSRLDFNRSRGTLHRKLIKSSLANLNFQITETNRKINELTSQIASLASQESRELERTLATIIVNNELSIPGIGPVLKERVIRSCFDGTLGSIRRASGVHGIGEQKYSAIFYWVNSKEANFAHRLSGDFPGKRAIVQGYVETKQKLTRELDKTNQVLKDMTVLREVSKDELNKLEQISAFNFSKAYKGDKMAAEQVTQYLAGSFPEWSKTPTWFETLIAKYSSA